MKLLRVRFSCLAIFFKKSLNSRVALNPTIIFIVLFIQVLPFFVNVIDIGIVIS